MEKSKGVGYSTSSFFYRDCLIVSPEVIFMKPRVDRAAPDNGLMVFEGGKVTKVELPKEGWVLEWDKPTGLPSNTSKEFNKAERIFGDDVCYFNPAHNISYHQIVVGFRGREAKFNDNLGPFVINLNSGRAFDNGYASLPCHRTGNAHNITIYRKHK